MRYTINVGLNSGPLKDIAPARVLAYLADFNINFTGAQILQPKANKTLLDLEEPTLVVDFWYGGLAADVADAVYLTAHRFDLGSIGMFRWPGCGCNADGVHVGPDAYARGRFDPAKFYLLTGEQLCCVANFQPAQFSHA